MKTPSARTTAVIAGSALAAGIGLVALSTSALAVGAPYGGSPVGTLDIRPATGSNQSAIDYVTSGPCPSGSTNFRTLIFGKGFPDVGELVTSSTTAGFSTVGPVSSGFAGTPQSFADLDETPNNTADANDTILLGRYDVVLRCTTRFGSTSLADYRSVLNFTTPTAYTAVVGDPNASPAPSPTAASPSPTAASPSPTAASPSPTAASPSPTAASPSPTAASPSPTAASPSPTAPACSPATVVLSRGTIVVAQSSTARVSATPGSTVELYAYTQPSTTYRLVRTAVTGATGYVDLPVRPNANTRLYAVVKGCTPNVQGGSKVLSVRVAITLSVERNADRSFRFSGDSVPARSRGLIVGIYRVGANGAQTLIAITRADGVDGTFEVDVTLPRGRAAYAVRTGADVMNAPGSSGIRAITVP